MQVNKIIIHLKEKNAKLRCWWQHACIKVYKKLHKAMLVLKDESGQGTTEYAILVGVLVVIAILAIAIFRPKLEELWNAIADGINGL